MYRSKPYDEPVTKVRPLRERTQPPKQRIATEYEKRVAKLKMFETAMEA